MLIEVLQKNNFSKKEAKIYLAWLKTWLSPASKVAKEAKENRVTTYTILKKFCENKLAEEIIKKDTKYYKMIDPELLFLERTNKIQKLENSLPELLAITKDYKRQSKNYFYDWYDSVQNLYKKLIQDASKFPSREIQNFVTTKDIDPKMKQRLTKDFQQRRQNFPVKIRDIYSFWTKNRYEKIKIEKYENIYIDDKIFQITNEIILHPNNKIIIASLKKNEIYAVVIENSNLYTWLKNIFNLVRNYHIKILNLEKKT